MAAGRGRRMMPLTQVIPKPMAPFRDSTLIADGIGKIRRYIPNVHVTVGYKGAVLVPHLIEQGVRSILNTDGQPNSWWIYNTLLRYVDEPVFVLTCDNITEIDFALLESDYQDLGQPACMLVPARPVEGLEGDYIIHDRQIVRELNRTTPSEMYCSGIQILNPSEVKRLTLQQGDFYSVWDQLIGLRQLMVSTIFPTNWFSVDTLADLQRVTMQPAIS